MIVFDRVTKRFPGAERAAIEDVSLSIAQGRITGLIGPSGAGKSTLVRLVNALERPDGGRVTVFGEDVAQAQGEALRALRRRTGMIFQGFGLLASSTVAGNVGLPLDLAGEPTAAKRARLAELLDLVGLAGLGARYPAQLSGGQKQRVGIARALATRPDILLCDEATSALDPETARTILQLLDRLNRELALTILLVTHQMEAVREICDDVVVLEAGRVVERGPVSQLFLAPQHGVTQRMIAEGDPREPLRPPPGALIVRATFEGEAARSPIIGRVTRETGADIVILDGRIGRLRSGEYSQLLLAITGTQAEAAIARLGTEARIERVVA
jgi:D-methionine transport system ATP-binding protein